MKTETSGGSKKYISIYQGKFSVKLEDSDINTITNSDGTETKVHRIAGIDAPVQERTDKNGNIRKESLLENLIVDIKSTSLDDKYNSFMLDIGSGYSISIPSDSSYYRSLILSLRNLESFNNVKLVPYNFIPKGKDKPIAGITIYDSNGNKVDKDWSDVPEPKPTKKKGKETFDYSEQEEFLYSLGKEFSLSESPKVEEIEQGAEDDLPF